MSTTSAAGHRLTAPPPCRRGKWASCARHEGLRAQQGHEVVTEWTLEYCPGGVRHRVAKYSLNHGE